MYVSRTNFIQSGSRARRVFVSPPAFINRTHLHAGALSLSLSPRLLDARSASAAGIIFPIRYKYRGRIFEGNTEYEIGRVSSRAKTHSIREQYRLAYKIARKTFLRYFYDSKCRAQRTIEISREGRKRAISRQTRAFINTKLYR